MRVEWTEAAIQDLQSVRRYIAYDSAAAANRVVKKILNAAQHLSEQPSIGRQGRVLHTRELIIPKTPYVVPYRVKNSVVEILRVFHGAMEWPEEF